MSEFWDKLGVSASLVCILHCLATPLFVVILPFLDSWQHHGWFHYAMAAVVIPVAVGALWNGYRLHRDRRVLWMGASGILLLSLAFGLSQLDVILTSLGGAILASAHLLNLRDCRRSSHPR